MKAILEFKLPEEQDEFDKARKGFDLHYNVIHFYENSIRKRLKYSELDHRTLVLMEELKEEFFEIFTDLYKL